MTDAIDEFDKLAALHNSISRLPEFIGGKTVEKPSDASAVRIAQRIGYSLLPTGINEIAHLTGDSSGFHVSGERYAPNVSVTLRTKSRFMNIMGYNSVAPNIAVEVDIPSYPASKEQLLIKVGNYLAAGTTVWVVFPETRQVHVYVPGQPVKILGENDTLDGGDVLPNLTLPVKNIFADLLADE